MTEEIKNEEIKDEKCKCDKKALKIFLLNILGSFLGCLVALCVFSAAVRPQLPPPPQMPWHRMEQARFHHEMGRRPENMRRFEERKFDKRFENRQFDKEVEGRQLPPDIQKPQVK